MLAIQDTLMFTPMGQLCFCLSVVLFTLICFCFCLFSSWRSSFFFLPALSFLFSCTPLLLLFWFLFAFVLSVVFFLERLWHLPLETVVCFVCLHGSCWQLMLPLNLSFVFFVCLFSAIITITAAKPIKQLHNVSYLSFLLCFTDTKLEEEAEGRRTVI